MPISRRHSPFEIDQMFLDRWSPRAFTGEAIDPTELMTILEAARWAPSAYNSQPWRFVYAHRDTPAWKTVFDLLTEANQVWAKNAAALVVLVSNSLMRRPGTDREVPSRTHSLDAGTASGFLALQANRLSWYVHGMIGLDFDRAFADLGVPAGFHVEAMYAIGRVGDPARLPEHLREREAPNDRVPLEHLTFEGRFPDHPAST